MPVTKRKFVETHMKCRLVIMALVVFWNKTLAENIANDEVQKNTNKMYLPMVNFGPGLFQTAG